MGENEADRLARGEGAAEREGLRQHQASKRAIGLAVRHRPGHGRTLHHANHRAVGVGHREGARARASGERIRRALGGGIGCEQRRPVG